MSHTVEYDTNVPQIVRVWAHYYGIDPGEFDPDAASGNSIPGVIYANDVVSSATPLDQGAAIRAHVATIRVTGGVGKIVLPPSSEDQPIWIGSKIDLDDLLYLEICGQGDPGLSGGWGTVLRQIALTEDSEVRIFEATDTTGNGVYYFHDFAIWGAAQDFPSFNSVESVIPVSLYGAERVTFRNVGCYYTRNQALTFARCGMVDIDHCRAENNIAAFNLTDCDRRSVTNCTIRGCGDDSIAFNSHYLDGPSQREPSIISGNMIEDSYGIKLAGIIKCVVTGNTLDRSKGYGIQITLTGGGGSNGEGDSTDIVITDNIITNTINSNKWAIGASNAAISIQNDITSFSAPVVAGTTPFINLPELVSPISNSLTNANAGGQRILISNNVFSQTLPQVDNYSDWGFGLSYFHDGFEDVSNLNSEFHCLTIGVLIDGAWVDVTVKDNLMERVKWGVVFATTFTYVGYCGVIGNKIRRCPFGGAVFADASGSTVKYGKIDIRDNEINADPFFESTNRDYINGSTATVTINNSSPSAVTITWAAHGLPANTAVRFTTTGALPAGMTANTTVGAKSYYVRASSLAAGSFTISAYPNGPAIVTTSAGSGVHTGFASIPDGTWTTGDGTPYIADIADFDGTSFTGNRVRNLNSVVLTDSDTRVFIVEGNVVFMQPSASATFAVPAHVDNKGVRDPSSLLRGGMLVYEDSDPVSATYGQTTNRVPARAQSAMPTSGFFLAGELVINSLYTVASATLTAGSVVEYALMGWLRMTTGSNHVLNTDWKELRALTGIGGQQIVNAQVASLVITGKQVT